MADFRRTQLEDALRGAATKLDVCKVLGVGPTTVTTWLRQHYPDLRPAWRSLPGDGVYQLGKLFARARGSTASALVDRAMAAVAAAGFAPSEPPTRHDLVRLLLAMRRLHGSSLPIGTNTALASALGVATNRAFSVRRVLWVSPAQFVGVQGADETMLAELIAAAAPADSARAEARRARFEAALRGSSTRKEAADRLGMQVFRLHSAVASSFPELMPALRSLAIDGLPPPGRSQAESDSLVARAAADLAEAGFPLSARNPTRQDVVRLLVGMYAIAGSMNFRRGWVRSIMLALDSAGCSPSDPASLRWHRVKLCEDPEQFAGVPGLDPDAFADLCVRSGIGRR
jgi:hypothetical protein